MILKDKLILVTGGAKGLGLTIANYLHEQNAKIIIADIDAGSIPKLPLEIERYTLDVTKLKDAREVVGKIVDKHGRIDVLVNNAGMIYSEPMVNIMGAPEIMHDLETYRNTIAVNMDSVFIMSSAVIEKMVLLRTKGVIVNISSISARGNEGQTAYSAAKAGVNAMTVTWSKELGKLGIRCNAVAPGFIDTDSTRNALHETMVKHVRSNTPLRRLGIPVEVAQAVASLIENDFINGVVLDVNGGLTI